MDPSVDTGAETQAVVGNKELSEQDKGVSQFFQLKNIPKLALV